MDKCIDFSWKPKPLSTLNANSGNCEIEMNEKEVKNTAFVALNGLYKYTEMPSGLKTIQQLYKEL